MLNRSYASWSVHSINPSKSHFGFGWQTCLILLGKKMHSKIHSINRELLLDFLLALPDNRGYLFVHIWICFFVREPELFFISLQTNQTSLNESPMLAFYMLLATLTSTFVPKPLNPDTVSYRMTLLQNRWKIRNGLRQRHFINTLVAT